VGNRGRKRKKESKEKSSAQHERGLRGPGWEEGKRRGLANREDDEEEVDIGHVLGAGCGLSWEKRGKEGGLGW